MVVSRTWRGMLHDNMVTMWVHISERGRPGAAPSQVVLMEAQRHQVKKFQKFAARIIDANAIDKSVPH